MNKMIPFIVFFIFISNLIFSQVSVIANRSVPIDKAGKSQLLDYYSGEIKYWSDNKPIIVFDLKPKTDTKEKFYEYIAKNTARMKSIWMKKLLSGEGDPPLAVNSEEEMLQKVQNTPGSIGFISSNKVKGNIKVISVIKEKD
ncbi:MAG TPA: hypothetical protein PL041_15900 [Melioribacteraceae bacterium]|nr:hypothetical protein [Melioribacteraceae bacterium]